MIFAVVHWLMGALMLVSLAGYSEAQAVQNRCCTSARAHVQGKTDTKCDAATAELTGIRNDLACREVWISCCLGTKRKLLCREGTRKAKQNKVCSTLRSGTNVTEQQYCCSCCRAGFEHGIANKDCNVRTLDSGCDDEARSCCVDIKKDHRLRALITQGRVKNKSCRDRPCSHICITTFQGYQCMCRNGYKLLGDASTCRDIDECAEDPNRCGKLGTCINLFGGFYCNCERGYKHSARTGKCEDIDECTAHQPCSHQCQNTVGSFKCVCPYGHVLGADRKTCARIDLGTSCKNNPCKYKCQALTAKRYQCICPSGYRLSRDYVSCRDVNECASGRSLCQGGTTCFNTYGHYKCVPMGCPKRYFKKVGLRYCIKSTCAATDSECRNDKTYSYQWLPSAQPSELEPRTLEYYYSLTRPSFPADVRFEIHKGNEDDAFFLEQAGPYKVFLRNGKKLVGPKDYAIELHINIYTNGKLYTRLVNTFYIYVSSHKFL